MSELNQLYGQAEQVSLLLKTMAHPERLLVLCTLCEGEANVGLLHSHSKLGQSAFSQHLQVLKEHGLVKVRKQSQMVFYSLADERIQKLLGTLQDNFCQDMSKA
ncbi:transcriptional regulator [Alginatibacterium sediminis]|uniref:Transcriptional regulator n=1 Tax=Alginatibacterium sediminis TaxID=2164068 RepID=A0A420ECY4_9ALTE|nr:metalloregulator ArsR/SmtB family transcription factor [Alginatibacterium sediminis]RKF18540.1 transcriptional regulator [Alginatibacterium sediminis]